MPYLVFNSAICNIVFGNVRLWWRNMKYEGTLLMWLIAGSHHIFSIFIIFLEQTLTSGFCGFAIDGAWWVHPKKTDLKTWSNNVSVIDPSTLMSQLVSWATSALCWQIFWPLFPGRFYIQKCHMRECFGVKSHSATNQASDTNLIFFSLI